ncbi:hypothetical protein [Arthrobacter sp. ERGS1:01]|uniref:hypothetical protein n=1 Tax=Arthrobacter sp. ERGS1:01 TaxID=1704044 RepID=UPI0006B50A70|nr:hypothetical protein [Arthrobacter sp. ERGS1:01]
MLSSLYVSLALVGIAALGSAAASSLIPGLAQGPHLHTPQRWNWEGWPWAGGIAVALFAVAALAYAVVSFRAGRVPRPRMVVRTFAVAVAVQLAALLEGVWRFPADTRTFDLTLASLIVLELSVIAVLGWQRTSAQRLRTQRGSSPAAPRREPSAAALIGVLFAASIFVAAVASAGMAASSAGELAVPHSGHGGGGGAPGLPGNLVQLENSGHHH